MYRRTNNNRSKRRKIMHTRSIHVPVQYPTTRIFENVRAYIYPWNINSSRRKVLHNLIQKHGGYYSVVPDNQTTHILVDESCSSVKLCRCFGWKIYTNRKHVLFVSWISASVSASRCLDPFDYKVPVIHRNQFRRGHHIFTPENTAAAGSSYAHSDASSSTSAFSEDADAELPNFGYVYEESSAYEAAKYDEEIRDDECLCERPTLSMNTCIVNPSKPNTLGAFLTNSFLSSSNLNSPLPITPKKIKVEHTLPLSWPDTLAAQLRRVQEHLRVPVGRSTIVELNRENFPQPSSKNIADDKIVNQSDSEVVVSGIQNSVTDEKSKAAKVPSKSLVASKTETDCPQIADISFDCQFYNNLAAIRKAQTANQNQSTESSTKVSEDKNNISIAVFSPDEQFDVETVNEVSQVVTMIVESVIEVAACEKIINESIVEISKNAMENDDSADENICN